MLNRNVERLRAEHEIRELHILRAAQASGEQSSEFYQSLIDALDKPMKTLFNPEAAQPEENFKSKLSAAIGRLNSV